MYISNCKVCHLDHPLGYRMDRPVFSYTVEDAVGKKQRKARIRVAKDAAMQALLLDTGFTDTISSLAYEADISLSPRTRYYWTVTICTDAGETAESAVQWFETGKREEGWSARWITCDSAKPRHPIFCKTLPLKDKAIRDARLYICGLGVYEAALNGERIGNEHLTPYINDYRSWLQVQTFDVTDLLGRGGALEVALGNGWYKGRFGFIPLEKKNELYGDEWRLIAEIHVSYADGSEDCFGTDDSWTIRRGTITDSSIYDGETRDDTLPALPEEPAILYEGKSAPLLDRLSPPVVEHEHIHPTLIHTPAGETVVDLGQNITGSFRLRVREPAGTKLHLQFGEVLQDGNFYRGNLRSALAEYRYTSDGVDKIIEPKFTFYGYRYAKIEGASHFVPEDFTGVVLHTALDFVGNISTGNTLLNQLIHNVRWGLKGNFLDQPTDCPQRDERMGWTGDAQVFSVTAHYLTDPYAFYTKYLYDMALEQAAADGKVPNTIPSVGSMGCSTAWGDATCIIPWNMYCLSGDKTILKEHYPAMRAWVDYITRLDGDSHHWREVFHFGDWLALDTPTDDPGKCDGGTEHGFIADTYYRRSALLTAKAARLLGKEEEAAAYEALGDKILQGLREEYFTASGRCAIPTQTACALTLRDRLEPHDRAAAMLKKLLDDSGGMLKTGFVGTPELNEVLCENGLYDYAYRLLLNEEYPGWLYEVLHGATTIWERWNSILPDGHINLSAIGMNSLNHYAFGAIVGWMWRWCVGLRVCENAPGFKSALIEPLPRWELREVKGEYASAAGTYRVAWQMADERRVHLELTVPFDCTAKVHLLCVDALPEGFGEDGTCTLAAGSYAFDYTIRQEDNAQ